MYNYILHEIVLPEIWLISTSLKWKCSKKCPICNILCGFGRIWDHMTHSEDPYSTNKVHLRVHILPKVSINCYYQKKNSFISFWSENVWEVPKMSYFMQFWPIFGPYYPLKNPLHYQRSSLKGSYSPKILHKIVLPENGFISIFLKWKCSKSAQNVNFMQF